MKARVEIRLKPGVLTFAAWERSRHEACNLLLGDGQAPLISALVQSMIGSEPLPETWTLIVTAGELVIEGAGGHRQSFALGAREQDTRLELATLVAACVPDGGESMLERIAAVQRLESQQP